MLYNQGTDHLILPLMAMVGELTRRQQELIKIIQTKDKQIDDYKSQGAKCSRSKYCKSLLYSHDFSFVKKTITELFHRLMNS